MSLALPQSEKFTDRHDMFVIASVSICSLECVRFSRVCGHFQVSCFQNPINMNFVEFTIVHVKSFLGGMCFPDIEVYMMFKKLLTKKL